MLAGDGDEAMSIVQREPVHLLLTDLHMPRMSGLEIIRQVRRFELAFPCILLSAGVDDQIVEQARDVDAFSVLQKPVRFLEIMQVVRDAMQAAYGWSDDV